MKTRTQLRQFREANDLKQETLAEYLGLSRSHISGAEIGRTKLSRQSMKKIMENPYGWDTSMLVGNSQSPIHRSGTRTSGLQFKRFREENGLYQADISRYLGVSKGYVSSVESGRTKLSKAAKSKLLLNQEGWDTAPLDEPVQEPEEEPTEETEILLLRERISHLETLLAEKERLIQILLEKK